MIGLDSVAFTVFGQDLVGVPLNFANGYAFSGLVYVIYGALVLWGMRDWWLRSRKVSQPVMEGAPA